MPTSIDFVFSYASLSFHVSWDGADWFWDCLKKAYSPFMEPPRGLREEVQPQPEWFLQMGGVPAWKDHQVPCIRSEEGNHSPAGNRWIFAGQRCRGWWDTREGRGEVLISEYVNADGQLNGFENALRVLGARLLLSRRGFLLHTAGLLLGGEGQLEVVPLEVVPPQEGFLLAGESGSGKTTLASCFSPSEVLGDETLGLVETGGKWRMYPTPFWGDLMEQSRSRQSAVGRQPSSRLETGIKGQNSKLQIGGGEELGERGRWAGCHSELIKQGVPLKAIFFLRQASFLERRPLSRGEALVRLLKGILCYDVDFVSVPEITALSVACLDKVPAYELCFPRVVHKADLKKVLRG